VKNLNVTGAWAIGLIAVLLVGVLGWQARYFEIDASADTLLTRGNEKYIQSKLVDQEFSPEEFLFVAYQPKNRPLLSDKTFEELRAITSEIAQLERVASVRSILNVPLPTLAETGDLGGLDTAALTIDRADFSIDAVSSAFRDDPIYEGLLIDSRQTVTALQVLFRPDRKLASLEDRITTLEAATLDGSAGDEATAELERLRTEAAPLQKRLTEARNQEVGAIRRIAEKYEDDANIYLGGVHVLGYQLVQIVRNDLIVFGAAIACLIALLLLVLFRELRWIVVAFACCLMSIVCTIGLFGLLGFKATVISANFVALQLILTLALVVHLTVQYREYARTQPDWSQARLIRETMRTKTPPSLYTGITTVMGFASLLASGIQPVISFGWMMVIAMAISLAVTLTLFPALLTILNRRTKVDEAGRVRHILDALANLSTSRALLVGVSAAVLLGVCVAGFPRLDVENSFINYFAESTDVHRELTFVDQNLGGSTPLDIVYKAPPAEADLLMKAETFQTMQVLQALLERHEAVGKILSPVNFTALAREINDGKPLTEYEITAVYRLMDEDLRESLLGSYFSPDTRNVRISMRIRDTTPGLDRAELLQELRDDIETALGEDADYKMTNLFVLYQDILERLFRSQVLTLGIVLVAVFVTFLVIFRSLRVALIAIVPNILVIVTVFGIMGWLRIALDLMTITIAAVAMGIAVDNSIHYIHRYRSEARTSDAASAIFNTHGSVGFGMLYTTAIIVVGFGSLAFSDFIPSVLFGVLTGVALSSAFLFNATVLPVLLARFPDRNPVR
jgi:predicted RND superfamily exporter protein